MYTNALINHKIYKLDFKDENNCFKTNGKNLQKDEKPNVKEKEKCVCV